jgi:hypothetical protein
MVKSPAKKAQGVLNRVPRGAGTHKSRGVNNDSGTKFAAMLRDEGGREQRRIRNENHIRHVRQEKSPEKSPASRMQLTHKKAKKAKKGHAQTIMVRSKAEEVCGEDKELFDLQAALNLHRIKDLRHLHACLRVSVLLILVGAGELSVSSYFVCYLGDKPTYDLFS